jgi:hypothetical protein
VTGYSPSRYGSPLWTTRLCSLVFALSGAANAAPADGASARTQTASCVVVRKPTAQQRQQSAADVERLLDEYEAKTSDNAAWPAALAAIFERFPVPAVNRLMALHHPAWAAPEKKLVAYVEATRQDPDDYADPAAVTQTIETIEQTLLPEVRHGPLLRVEARGVARREEIARLDVRLDNQACVGEPISVAAAYSVSWVAHGRRLTATVTPHPLEAGEDRCLAIDGDAIGPCDAALRVVEPPAAVSVSSGRPPPSRERRPAIRPDRARPPSLDARFAVPGLALAAAGFGLAAYARHQVDAYMGRADGECHQRQCSESGMSDVTSARDWKTGYYVAGVSGLVGLGALLASGHRYYADWLLPSPKHAESEAQLRSPSLVPIAAARGGGLLLRSRF